MALHYVKTETGRVYEIDARASLIQGERLPTTEGRRIYQEQALDSLRDILSHGDTVHCVLRSVSRNGETRAIDFYVIKENRPIWLSGYMAAAMGWRSAKGSGLLMKGVGMDMGFHAVYCLASKLWPKGNPNRDDRDGGYLLKSEWM